MNNPSLTLKLMVVCALLTVFSCQCNKCKKNRAPLIDEFRFLSLNDAAAGINHCTYEHTIGIAKGGNACQIAIVGLDGWGIADSASVVRGEITGPEAFKIENGIIQGRPGPACSGWRYLRVNGTGAVSANLLDLRVTYSDSSGQYNSGQMQYTFERQ